MLESLMKVASTLYHTHQPLPSTHYHASSLRVEKVGEEGWNDDTLGHRDDGEKGENFEKKREESLDHETQPWSVYCDPNNELNVEKKLIHPYEERKTRMGTCPRNALQDITNRIQHDPSGGYRVEKKLLSQGNKYTSLQDEILEELLSWNEYNQKKKQKHENDHEESEMVVDREEIKQEVIMVLDQDDSDQEYIQERMNYLFELEGKHRARSTYMSKQKDVNENMRAILVDWLSEVAEEYRLATETLYLAVNYMDRFLSQMHVARDKLQLVGVSSLLIAAKFEEITPPLVDDLVYICDKTYSHEEIRLMERQILKTLQFEVSVATIRNFVFRFLKAAKADETVSCLAHYLTEVSLTEYPFVRFLPSEVAASAVVLALQTLGLTYWNATMEFYTTYTLEDLMECVLELHRLYMLLSSREGSRAIREKYADSKFLKISTIKAKTYPPSGKKPYK